VTRVLPPREDRGAQQIPDARIQRRSRKQQRTQIEDAGKECRAALPGRFDAPVERATDAGLLQAWLEYPPSTGMAAPVTKSEARLARKTAMPAKSSGVPQRPAAVRVSTRSFRPGTSMRA